MQKKGSVKLTTNYYEKDKLLVFRINEEIDEFSVKSIRRKADYEIERFMPREVVFDFNSVTFMDSAGIGMVIRTIQAGANATAEKQNWLI